MTESQGVAILTELNQLQQWAQFLLYALEGVLFCTAAALGFWMFGGASRG